jgi:hypothetical protein
LRNNTAGVHVQDGQQQGISFLPMDVDILNVHTQLLHGFNGFLYSKANKLPFFPTAANDHATQKMVLFHQAVYFLFVNHKAIGLQVLGDFDVSGKKHKLLRKHKADTDHYTVVAD